MGTAHARPAPGPRDHFGARSRSAHYQPCRRRSWSGRDPEFRAALIGYAEWGSRLAMHNSEPEVVDHARCHDGVGASRRPTSRSMPWEWPVGAGCAFLVALGTTPAGVSGAVLLLPLQLSILHVPSPMVTPTNLLFNVAAVPGGLMRFWHERRLVNPLTGLLVAGTLPGVIAGAIIRVEWLSGGRAFEFVAAGVLLPLGLWLALGSQRIERPRPTPTANTRRWIWLLSLVVGTVGGIYGIGGGSLLAPVLLLAGFSAYEVAPATLAATFLTSIGGIVAYQVLQLSHGGAIAPDWVLGAFMGAGGFAGSYCGARLQRHLPEQSLRRLLGAIACLVALRYIQEGVTAAQRSPTTPHMISRPALSRG